jgi:hypothetical protein
MSDVKGATNTGEDWYLYVPSCDPSENPQPYRATPTAWPISVEEVKRTEAQAQSGSPSAVNALGNFNAASTLVLFAQFLVLFALIGMIHLFGWGKRPVNRYRAYDCFRRAHSDGCAAAANNVAVCKRLGYGCKANKEEAVAQLKALIKGASTPAVLELMASVSRKGHFAFH